MGHIYINKNFQGRFQTSKLFGQNPPCTIKLNGEKSINTITTNIYSATFERLSVCTTMDLGTSAEIFLVSICLKDIIIKYKPVLYIYIGYLSI